MPPTSDILRPEENPWWEHDINGAMQPQTRQMLKFYAGIPDDQVEERVKEIQYRAYEVAPYATIAALTWLNPSILHHPAHDRVLQRLRDGASIMDCSSLVAPDLRQLAFEGAPTDHMVSFDRESGFFDVGFEFYNDRDKWKGKFIAVDAFKPFEETQLGNFTGKMDIVWCSNYMHIFNREKQIEMTTKLISLLKPTAGSIFAGSQPGIPGGTEMEPRRGMALPGMTPTFFLADAPDLESMWEEISSRTGTTWTLEARLLDMRTIGMHNDDGSNYKRRLGYFAQWVATRK